MLVGDNMESGLFSGKFGSAVQVTWRECFRTKRWLKDDVRSRWEQGDRYSAIEAGRWRCYIVEHQCEVMFGLNHSKHISVRLCG